MALLAQTLALLAMTVATTAVEEVTLDMAQDSFDDQYWGCGSAMTAALPALNRSEFQQNPLFAQAWVKARAKWQSQGSRLSPLSSPAQAIALMAYTMKDQLLYMKFNEAVRTAGRSRQEYPDKFHFKTLHFLLTDALATLRQAQNRQCHNVYRGANKPFNAKMGDIVRFGQFASTSQSETIAKSFGGATVFQVYTCHGVGIQEFSSEPVEKEVLIPPFETFKVTSYTQKKNERKIELHSYGTHSNYNCEWLQGGSVPRAPFHVGGLLLVTTTLAVATGIL